MKNIIIILIALVAFGSCQLKDEAEKKKEKLKDKKEELQELKEDIAELEKEIASLDPEYARKNRKATLITALPVEKNVFTHYLEISGTVDSKSNVIVSAENMGTILSIYVTEGDRVNAGQLLVSMDTELFKRALAQLEAQYELAKTMYEKQANLWEKNIGTEVQYLEAKTNKESLESQIDNVKTQIAKSQIRAPFTGTIEKVLVKKGEIAQPGTPIIQLVNHKGMYVVADLSESYIGKFNKGDEIMIEFPSLNETIKSTISSVGQVINEQNRTFKIEARIPKSDFLVKPNLIALLKLKDFEKQDAAIVPTNLIQKDNIGDYVFIVDKDTNNTVAKKIHIERGTTYKNKTMIDKGLSGDELLVNEGFRDVTDGNKVKIVENVL